jgi:hypothetical protein
MRLKTFSKMTEFMRKKSGKSAIFVELYARNSYLLQTFSQFGFDFAIWETYNPYIPDGKTRQ